LSGVERSLTAVVFGGDAKLLQRQQRAHRCVPCSDMFRRSAHSLFDSCVVPRLRSVNPAQRQALHAVYRRHRQAGGLSTSYDLLSYPFELLVHGQVTIIFVVSVGVLVCLFVCAEFFSAVFDPISIKLGHMLYVWV